MTEEIDPTLIEYCYYVQNDPKCLALSGEVENEVEEGPDDITDPIVINIPDEQKAIQYIPVSGDVAGYQMLSTVSPMQGQMTFTVVALLQAGVIALKLFKYRPISTTYTTGAAIFSINYWQIANMIDGYGGLFFWGVASITQLLSVFGVMADVNLLVWGQIGPLMGIVSLISYGLRLFAYDTAYDLVVADSTNTNATTVRDSLETELVEVAAMQAATGLALLQEKDNWLEGQWQALSEETRESIKASYEEAQKEASEAETEAAALQKNSIFAL